MIEFYQSPEGVVRRAEGEWTLLRSAPNLLPFVNERALGILATSDGETLDGAPVEFQKLLQPSNVALIGLNYESHASEFNQPRPAEIIWAVIDESSAAGPNCEVKPPYGSSSMCDYEGEIAVVVGAPIQNASPEAAALYIAGYAPAIDFTARDIQMRALQGGDGAPTMSQAKSFYNSKPLGPGMILASTVDYRSLELKTFVNGELRQQASGSEMVFSPAEILSEISKTHSLQPGDVVLTGTPAGVGFKTGTFLQDGDVVEVVLNDMVPLRAKFTAS